jgi:hypothetical protein
VKCKHYTINGGYWAISNEISVLSYINKE